MLPDSDQRLRDTFHPRDVALATTSLSVGLLSREAAGGGTVETPLAFNVGYAERTTVEALNGYLPEVYPLVEYMGDRPDPPPDAEILARNGAGEPALFQVGDNAFGFSGHPGVKVGMVEDLIMEFDEAPTNIGANMDVLRTMKTEIEDALVPIMTGLVQMTGLIRS